MQLTFSTPISSKWTEDDNGFLRVPARVLACGIMDYTGKEIGMDGKEATDIKPIYVPPQSAFSETALKSLEGMPVVAGKHKWIEAKGRRPEVGSVAGKPRANGGFIEVDLLIRDPATIADLKSGKLSDISAAYNVDYVMEPGAYQKESYDGKQENIRFNHIAILPPGKGRGGREIRVLNSAMDADTPTPTVEDKVMEYTQIQVTNDGHSVRVAKEDVHAFNKAMEAKDKEMQAKLAENKAKAKADEDDAVETMNALMDEVKNMKAKLAEKEGQLSEMQAKNAEATDPEKMEEMAKNMAEEKEEAAEIMQKNMKHKDKAKAKNSLEGLYGNDLKVAVINAVRASNGRPELSYDEAENEDFVRGVYSSLSENSYTPDAGAGVAGAGVIAARIQNNRATNANNDPLGFNDHKAWKEGK